MTLLFSVILPYLLGSLNGAYYITKFLKKKDIRTLESGNAGATNAGRVLGKKGFLLTVLIDAVKTWIALYLGMLWFGVSEWVMFSAILFVLLGHLYPVHLQFKGGKGIVVYLAGALWVEPLSLAAAAIVMGITFGLTRKYTISGFLAISMVPIVLFWLYGVTVLPMGMSIAFIVLLIAHQK
ncbi:glycerol-3-phosphate acyltransferase [Jeotgalibacillus sp. JSM ZJ347]|uniref:glycerol-3-phosphate acyltransferase n=1 Tax=Jeotgalibacillus sp. JSM ZJ347 TaxID=3342117 RepID=UPI0035A91C17